MARRQQADRRHGKYRRHLLRSLGNGEVMVPRTRTFSAHRVLGAYARRAPEIDRWILATFVLGRGTRKVSTALQPILGGPVRASTVSRLPRALDAAVAAFPERPPKESYRFRILDGVVLKHRTGVGALRRPLLVALGIWPHGRKEGIDFRVAKSERRRGNACGPPGTPRGLHGEKLERISVDGGKGTLAALPGVFPGVPAERSGAHKVRTLTDPVRRKDRDALQKGLRTIDDAQTLPKAHTAARRFAHRWERTYPKGPIPKRSTAFASTWRSC